MTTAFLHRAALRVQLRPHRQTPPRFAASLLSSLPGQWLDMNGFLQTARFSPTSAVAPQSPSTELFAGRGSIAKDWPDLCAFPAGPGFLLPGPYHPISLTLVCWKQEALVGMSPSGERNHSYASPCNPLRYLLGGMRRISLASPLEPRPGRGRYSGWQILPPSDNTPQSCPPTGVQTRPPPECRRRLVESAVQSQPHLCGAPTRGYKRKPRKMADESG